MIKQVKMTNDPIKIDNKIIMKIREQRIYKVNRNILYLKWKCSLVTQLQQSLIRF